MARGTVALASSANGSTKAGQLERVRNNQRRCRARRKDYVAELEEKIRRYETMNSTTILPTQSEQLIKENEMLKNLLRSIGLGQAFLKQYMNASESAAGLLTSPQRGSGSSAPEDNIAASPNMQLLSTSFDVASGQSPGSVVTTTPFQDATSENTQDLFESLLQSQTLSMWDYSSSLTYSQIAEPGGDTLQQASEQLLQPRNPEQELTDDAPTTTTLCSVAFSMIVKNNRKGYSQPELDLKLRAGYKCGLSASGACRVENKILFQVLAEIS